MTPNTEQKAKGRKPNLGPAPGNDPGSSPGIRKSIVATA